MFLSCPYTETLCVRMCKGALCRKTKKTNIFLSFFFFCQKNREVKKSGQNSELQYQFLLPFAFFRNDPLKLIIM